MCSSGVQSGALAIRRTHAGGESLDVAIYLVDYEQALLVPLPDDTDREPLEIDATMVFLEWPGPLWSTLSRVGRAWR